MIFVGMAPRIRHRPATAQEANLLLSSFAVRKRAFDRGSGTPKVVVAAMLPTQSIEAEVVARRRRIAEDLRR